jgi:hypothetical protein
VRAHRIPHRPTAAALVLALALALGACSSGTGDATSDADLGGAVTGRQAPPSTTTTTRPPTTTTGSGVDPTSLPRACTLLTQTDVEAAFGDGALNVTDSTDECWWSSADDLRTANLIRRTDDLDTWRAGFDNPTWRSNDLGDEGYTSTALGSVVWRVGEAQYEVNVIYSTSGDEQGDARDLAQRAAARL